MDIAYNSAVDQLIAILGPCIFSDFMSRYAEAKKQQKIQRKPPEWATMCFIGYCTKIYKNPSSKDTKNALYKRVVDRIINITGQENVGPEMWIKAITTGSSSSEFRLRGGIDDEEEWRARTKDFVMKVFCECAREFGLNPHLFTTSNNEISNVVYRKEMRSLVEKSIRVIISFLVPISDLSKRIGNLKYAREREVNVLQRMETFLKEHNTVQVHKLRGLARPNLTQADNSKQSLGHKAISPLVQESVSAGTIVPPGTIAPPGKIVPPGMVVPDTVVSGSLISRPDLVQPTYSARVPSAHRLSATSVLTEESSFAQAKEFQVDSIHAPNEQRTNERLTHQYFESSQSGSDDLPSVHGDDEERRTVRIGSTGSYNHEDEETDFAVP